MNEQAFYRIIARYRADLKRNGHQPHKQRVRGVMSPVDGVRQLQHALWMLDELTRTVKRGHLEEAANQLGFIQGILWAKGFYTEQDIVHHNKTLDLISPRFTKDSLCICPTECDCEDPPPDDGPWSRVYKVSNLCPEHNTDPEPNPDCPVH